MFQTLFSLLMLANLQFALPALPAAEFNTATLLKASAIPTKKAEAVEPVIKAQAALLLDLNTGTILYSKNIRQPLAIASLTKIMTAVVVMESHNISETVTIKNNYSGIDGTRMWFNKNDQVSVKDLLSVMLIHSANDAAMILAEYHSGKVDEFVREMNQKAMVLGLRNTRFINPVGFDEKDHASSAYDLAMLAKYALRKPIFRDIVRQAEGTLTILNTGKTRDFDSTNGLLKGYLDIEGVKTGTTDAAGECLINLARDASGKNAVLAVLLNSPNRFQESKSMIDWGFQNYAW